jgi:hypothetical protein
MTKEDLMQSLLFYCMYMLQHTLSITTVILRSNKAMLGQAQTWRRKRKQVECLGPSLGMPYLAPMVVQVNQRSPVIASTANLFTLPTHPFTSTHKRVHPGRAPALLLSRLSQEPQWLSLSLPSDGFP